ncbi:MAG: OmpA family protein [Paludibacteraceae bacterium]
MKRLFRNILTLVFLLTFTCGEAVVMAMPAPAAKETTAQDKKKAAAEKKKKEQEKTKAKKQKEQAKKKAEAARANEKKQAQRAKEQAARQKEAAKTQAQREKEQAARQKEAERRQAAAAEAQAEKAAQEEAQKQAWLRQQAELNDPTPKKEVVSLINLSGRVGYAAMMDKMGANYGNVNRPGQLGSEYAYQSLIGGPGAGFAATYELEYGHFRFETGLDFTWLNSTSRYEYMLQRQLLAPHQGTYNYITDDLRETRNIGYIGLPVMFGAEFSRYYFMLGVKVGYGLFGNYKQRGQYDIVVDDKALLEQYGLGIFDIPEEAADNHKLAFKQPSLSLCAEFGLDLDEWLQAQPDKKKQKRTKPGERLPFGREHVHYKVSAFAEYGVMNTNGASQAYPLTFETNDYRAQKTNSMLAMGGNTRLNNLFVGLKFTVQFEIPGKTARPVPPPASYTAFNVVDEATGQPMNNSTIQVTNTKNGRIALKEKNLPKGTLRQRMALGTFEVVAKADDYYPAVVAFSVEEPGTTTPVNIQLRHRPVFRVSVANKETGAAVPATVQIRKRGTEQANYSLTTDSMTGASQTMLADTILYAVHIEQMGYEPYDALVENIGDSMHIMLTPIKKGEVFVMKNLFFATNKTRILPTSEESMNAMFMFLERNADVRIKIIGHTDNVGKDAANQRLSEGRANAVRADLIERGIAPERIETEGRGESQPIDTNDTEEGRQNNRRVEIEIL